MRQEKTLKIRANHLLIPGTKIEPHAGSDKAWVWSAVDFAEGEQKAELFCLKFGTVEKTQEFKKQYEAGMAINAGLFAAPAVKGPSESEKAADELAAGVEAVAVAEGTASS